METKGHVYTFCGLCIINHEALHHFGSGKTYPFMETACVKIALEMPN